MAQSVIIIMSICLVMFVVSLLLAGKNGRKAAQLQRLKEELKKQAKEQRYAQEITQRVYCLSATDARRRLHDVANKHAKRMQ